MKLNFHNKTVNPYYPLKYDTKDRFASYWHQIKEVTLLVDQFNKNILDIGIGNSFLVSYLERCGIDIVTLDIDIELKPKVSGSVFNLPFKDVSFDIVTCFEVMEHLPFESFSHILAELHRVTKRYLVFSIPDRSKFFNLFISIYPIRANRISFSIPGLYKRRHRFDGEHYWELGKKHYSLSKIKGIIKTNGFKIIKSYRVPEKPIHHFFILKKS